MPSGKIDQPRIEDNRDGTVRVQYDPREDGIHELYVKYNGEHVQGKIRKKAAICQLLSYISFEW